MGFRFATGISTLDGSITTLIASKEKELASKGVGKYRLRRLYWWGRAFITMVLAWYLLGQIKGDFGQLKLRLEYPWYILLAFGAAISAVFCSVWVWRMMLPSNDRPGFLTLLAHYLLGFFYNHFLPSGFGGDVVRTGALVQGGQRLTQAANSVLMTRVAGLWSIVLLACFMVPVFAIQTGWQPALPWILSALSAFVAALAGSVVLFGTSAKFLVKILPARIQSWHRELQAYWGQPRLLLQALSLSFVIQILAVIVNTSMAQALGLPISFGMLMLTIPLVNLVILLPISIGGFGVREGAYFYLLSRFGVEAGQAVLLSLAVYVLLVMVAAVGAAISQFWLPTNGRTGP